MSRASANGKTRTSGTHRSRSQREKRGRLSRALRSLFDLTKGQRCPWRRPARGSIRSASGFVLHGGTPGLHVNLYVPLRMRRTEKNEATTWLHFIEFNLHKDEDFCSRSFKFEINKIPFWLVVLIHKVEINCSVITSLSYI